VARWGGIFGQIPVSTCSRYRSCAQPSSNLQTRPGPGDKAPFEFVAAHARDEISQFTSAQRSVAAHHDFPVIKLQGVGETRLGDAVDRGVSRELRKDGWRFG